jgi:hypothetical protein
VRRLIYMGLFGIADVSRDGRLQHSRFLGFLLNHRAVCLWLSVLFAFCPEEVSEQHSVNLVVYINGYTLDA